MSGYPIRPTFPLDVRSPNGSLAIGRQGASVTLDINPTSIGAALVTPTQFYAALEAFLPGASATIEAAVPSDPADPINRAYRKTSFITPGCALLTFIAATLALPATQVTYLLAQAALQPK